MKPRILSLLLVACLMLSCLTVTAQASKSDDIVILFENDVHCAVDGYAKLSAMKIELSETTAHVGVVSVGDFVQGSSLGVVSKGEYIVHLMKFYSSILL